MDRLGRTLSASARNGFVLAQSSEIGEQILNGLIAIFFLFVQRLADEALHFIRDVG